MVWQQALYLVNLLCKFVPCDYNFPYPDTSLSEPQAFKDLISFGFDEKDRDNPNSLKIGDGDEGWGWNKLEQQDLPEIDYTKNDSLVVITKTGKLRGYWMKIVGGRKIRAFEGIPYAEPAIGYFRFSEPSPKIPWAGLHHANKKGPKCLQFSQIELKRIVGSEDCLCLNVYTPKIPWDAPKSKQKVVEKWPVLIYIHGGGFQVGSGNDYGPSYLLQRDIILVTFNYRVGVFGFMSTGDKFSPGNYGLKDQALAIQWIYENIGVFNGDPLKITLLGQEAGSASVHLQMISLRARPFFQAGISMSGTAFNPWVFCSKKAAHDLTKYFAKKFNCPFHSSEAIVSCLRRVDAGELAKAQIKFLDDLPIPIYLFRPVLEDVQQKEPPFLTDTPENLYRNNAVARIPWIAGFTEDEGLTFLLPSVFRRTIKQIRQNWNALAPDFLDYENLGVDKDEVTKKINWLYFKQNSPLTATIKTFSDAVSLRFTVQGVHKALQAHSALAPTYAYMFSYNGKYNLATLAGIKPSEWGVGQGEDLFYLLNSTHFYQGFGKNDHELILSKIMVNLFGNFAAKRYPTFTLENQEDFQIWNPITDPRNMSFLLIHKKIKMIAEPYLKQSVYWESVGLPDMTPYINSTEHYRDYHYISSTESPALPPSRTSSYSYPNREMFDWGGNISQRSPSPSTQLVPPGPEHKDGDVEIEDSEPQRDLETFTPPTSITYTTIPSIPSSKKFSLKLGATTTSPPRRDLDTPTEMKNVAGVNHEHSKNEDQIFLPPWNPFGTFQKTLSTSTSTTTTPSTPSSQAITIKTPESISSLSEPWYENLEDKITTTTPIPASINTLDGDVDKYEVELDEMINVPGFATSFSTTTTTPTPPVLIPNSFNLLDDISTTPEMIATTTAFPIISKNIPKIKNDNDEAAIRDEDVEKIEFDFEQMDPLEVIDDGLTTTTPTTISTTQNSVTQISTTHDPKITKYNSRGRGRNYQTYIQIFPHISQEISDHEPYNIMK